MNLLLALILTAGTINGLVFTDQHGKNVYLHDTLRKYDYTVLVYSYYKNAKKGKKLRLRLEETFKNSRVKVFEMAYLKLIPKLFRGLLKTNMKAIRRQLLLDFEGVIKERYNLNMKFVNVLMFKGDSLVCVLKNPAYEDVVNEISYGKHK